MSRVLLVGLDGATRSVLDPAFEAGRMPVLNGLLSGGSSGTLTSTIPPYTPPGWTSIFTGVDPGKHGIYGFHLGNAQRQGGLVRLDRVRAPAIWNAANAQGRSIGLFNIPMTFPPPSVDGFCVSGMLAPDGSSDTPPLFTHPPDLGGYIGEAVGSYRIDIDVDYNLDWRGTGIMDRLSANLALKRKALRLLLQERYEDLSLLFVVFEAPDRLMHTHYKYLDPRCEHFHRPEAEGMRERAWDVFDEIDEAVGELVDWAGPESYTVVMSDHGFGPRDKEVNVNVALRQWGMLSVGGLGSVTRSSAVRSLARKSRKVLPRAAFEKAAPRAPIDWTRTRAFAAPAPQQGVYVNLEGREPHGSVPASEYERTRDEIISAFDSLIDQEDGRSVVDRVYRREEVMDGPEAASAPDLFPVCRGYSYELSDALHAPDVLEDHRAHPRGFHQIDGIFAVAGPGVPARAGMTASVYDIAPTALHLAGLWIPATDGKVLEPALAAGSHPVERRTGSLPAAGEGAEAAPYTAEEEHQIEESLRGLGYL